MELWKRDDDFYGYREAAVNLTMLLADAAQDAPGGKVSALGIGWTRIPQPVAAFSIIGFAELTGAEAVQPHDLAITLCDLDGNPVMADADHVLIRVDVQLQGQVADDLEEYECVRLQFAIPIPGGMPVEPGGYQFKAVIDDDPAQSATYRFRVTPGPQRPTGPVIG